MPPSCQSINLWNTKKVKSMRGVVTVNWSWSPNGVWIRWPYYDLWLKYWIYVIYGIYTPMSHRSHLSFSPPNCPGKTKFYTWSKWECKIQQNRQETGLKGGFFQSKTSYRREINHKTKHFYNTHTQFTQLTPQFPVCRCILDSNAYKELQLISIKHTYIGRKRILWIRITEPIKVRLSPIYGWLTCWKLFYQLRSGPTEHNLVSLLPLYVSAGCEGRWMCWWRGRRKQVEE